MSRRFGAHFIDYSRSDMTSRQEYFYNSQHLNADGAAKFTRELAARLVNDGLLAAPTVGASP